MGVKVSKEHLRGVLRSFGWFRANNGVYGEWGGEFWRVLKNQGEFKKIRKF